MTEYSYAVAFAAPVLAVISTILISCGIIAESDADLEAVATDFYNSLDGDVLTDITTIADAYASVGTGNFTFRVSPGILNFIANWFTAKDWSFSDAGLGAFTVAGGTEAIFQGFDFSSIYRSDIDGDYVINQYDRYNSWPAVGKALFFSPSFLSSDILGHTFRYTTNAGSTDNFTIFIRDGLFYFSSSFGEKCIDSIGITASGGVKSHYGDYILWVNGNNYYPFPSYNGATGSVTTFPTANVQSDTTYFPQEVTTAGDGTTTFPSNTASKPLTTETPLTIPEAGVNSGTGVGDVRGEAGTVPGEQTGTILGWLEKIWDGVCSIPGAIAGAITAVIDFVTSLVVPSATLWDDFMGDVVEIVAPPNSVDFTSYVSSIEIPDVHVNWKGDNLTIVDNSNLRANVETWRKYIGAFLAVLLIIYNYNMFMKLMGMGKLTLTDSGRAGASVSGKE